MQRTKTICFLAFLSALLLISPNLQATHIRAGDLVTERITSPNNIPNELWHKVTVTLYRDMNGIEAGEGLIDFGDGTDTIAAPVSQGFIQNGATEIIKYEVVHQFPSPGIYNVSYFERNRNEGVVNMFASGQTPFYIETTIVVNPSLDFNKTPVFSVPAVGQAILGQKYIYNAGANDFEGDSLSFELVTPLQSKGLEVVDYVFPNEFADSTETGDTPGSFSIDPETGFITWDAPSQVGEYNIAFKVNEWRKESTGYRKIGAVTRDMQIIVRSCSQDCDRPTFNQGNISRVAVEAGEVLDFTKIATSQTSFGIDIDAYSLLFEDDNNVINSPTLTLNDGNSASARVVWETDSEDSRDEPYAFYFYARDNRNDGLPEAFNVAVLYVNVGNPKPTNLVATANDTDKSVALSWNAYSDSRLTGYELWRRVEKISSISDDSTVELAWLDEYIKIAELDQNTLAYTDVNLIGTSEYSYRLVARLGTERSLPSNRATALITCNSSAVVADFSFEIENFQIRLTNSSSNAHTYFWNFGDGQLDTTFLTQTAYDYNDLGNFQVSLTASNGCQTAQITKSITISSYIDQTLNKQISIFPNPLNRGQELHLQSDEQINLKKVYLFNTSGQQIPVQFNRQEGKLILGNDVGAGVYLIILETKEGNSALKRVIIN